MTFGEAIEAIRMGKRVQRDGWGDLYIMLVNNIMTLMPSDNPRGSRWLPSHEAIFALDWKEVE